ncbi:hypothetical protein [Embleya sp. NPDC020630]|uniref:hypothetical protein n=1 Tax=Embleya sp. NPDC020630 TaxID=3363979 RepID=UPI0037B26D77
MTRGGIGAARVGKALGLVPRQVRLAARTGLLAQHQDGTFDADAVARAAADPGPFLTALQREEPLTATEAAQRLGISRERFRRVARAAGLAVVDRVRVSRYGRDLEVRYYRTADVDTLHPHIAADRELREAARTVSRSLAAAKAAATRAHNRERAHHARSYLATLSPDQQTDPADAIAFACALARLHGTAPARLRRFMADPRVRDIAEIADQCRFKPEEIAELLTAAAPRAIAALRALARPHRVWATLGVPAEDIAHRVPSIDHHISVDLLHELATDPPRWLLELHADRELEHASAAVTRWLDREWHAQQRRAEAVCRAAEAVIDQLADDAVAELFALPVEVIVELRPRSNKWTTAYVEELLHTRPLWLRSLALAHAEIARRAAARTRREAARTQRRLNWRRTWARALSVPLDTVPDTVERPTPAALHTAQTDPPPWARPH